jgi:uncharacterized protein (DUF433 family)
MDTELLKRITANPGIINGKPVIRGMRFSVAGLFGYLASWMTQDEILNDFPYLDKDDISAALVYTQNKVDPSIISVQIDATK